jgi:ATP-dependent protease ClpP protease subunit
MPSPHNKNWYRFENNIGSDETTLFIYDEISSYGISAQAFASDLGQVKSSTINLRVNSPGGDVFDGCTIHNLLKEHPATVKAQVDGLCASIASVIVMAADKITMAKNAMMMIHNASGICWGNAHDMTQMADVLAKIDKMIVTTYADRTGCGKRDLTTMMAAETWMNAEEAKAKGFCDSIGTTAENAKASFDLSKFQRVPEEAKALFARSAAITERDIENRLRDSGVSKTEAQTAIAEAKALLRDSEDKLSAALMDYASENMLISLMTT